MGKKADSEWSLFEKLITTHRFGNRNGPKYQERLRIWQQSRLQRKLSGGKPDDALGSQEGNDE